MTNESPVLISDFNPQAALDDLLDRTIAENTRLREEVERLRAALDEIISFKCFGFAITAPNGTDVYCEGTTRFVREDAMIKVRSIARAALTQERGE